MAVNNWEFFYLLLCVGKCSPSESYKELEYWAAVEVPKNAYVLTVQELTTHNSSSDALSVDGWTTIS